MSRIERSSFSCVTRIWEYLVQGLCIDQKEPDKALSVLRDCMRSHGVLPSSSTFCSLIYCFITQGRMDKVREVLQLMTDEKFDYRFGNFVTSSVISKLCSIKRPELAVWFYNNAVNSGAFQQPDVVTYTTLVIALCEMGRFQEVFDLICRLEKERIAFDVVFCSSLVCGYFRKGHFREAFQKYIEMVDKGVNPDTVSYTILIDGFCKLENVEKAVGLLHKMKKDGIKPNLITYTAIILGYIKKRKLEEAFAVFNLVEDLGIEMDEFIYAVLIDGVCKKGDFSRAFDLLHEMEKKGISPSIITYNSVINGLCKFGRTSEADEVARSINGDIITYSTLLHGYIIEENVMGILEIKKRLLEARVCFDVTMCNVLLKALFMVGAFEDACMIYKEMPEKGLAADSVTDCTMIDGYCKAGRIDEALQVFDEFRRTKILSVECYNCVIRALCKKGMVEVAINVFMELNEKGLNMDKNTYRMMIKVILQEKGSDKVLDLIHSIENLGLETYSVMCNEAIYLLCRRGFWEAASYVYMAMKKKGSILTSKSYSLLLKRLTGDEKETLIQPIINTFVKEYGLSEPRVSKRLIHYLCMKNFSNALLLLEKMKENNLYFIVPITVLETLTKKGRVLDAYKLIMKAKDNLPVMDVVDYSIIVDGLCKSGYLDKALTLCDFIEKKGINLNIVTYNTVINGLCLQGCLLEAFRIFDSLESINLFPSEITYAILINYLCKEGFLLDAKRLFDKMVLKGLKPNTRIYNSLIDGHCKLGEMEEALKLLLDLEMNFLKADSFTVSAVISGYCQKGDMEAALGFFIELKKKEVLPDFLGFLHLIRGLCSKGRMEEARNVLREMLQTQSALELIERASDEIETESIGGFLVSLCEQGSIQESLAVLNEIGSMFFPVEKRLRSFSNELGKLKNIYEVEAFGGDDIVSKSLTSNDKVDFGSYYSLIASLFSKGELKKANRLAKEILFNMCKEGC